MLVKLNKNDVVGELFSTYVANNQQQYGLVYLLPVGNQKRGRLLIVNAKNFKLIK